MQVPAITETMSAGDRRPYADLAHYSTPRDGSELTKLYGCQIDFMLTSLLLFIAAGLNSTQDEIAVRDQETVLATALRAGDKGVLVRLTDSKFYVSLNCGSGVNSYSTDLDRDSWVGDI